MDEAIAAHLAGIRSGDRDEQGRSYTALMEATDAPVGWAHEAWDGLLADLRSGDNRLRSIASQLLCNLARSDPDAQMLGDFDALIAVTRDKRFVTARHCLLSLWKVGTAGPRQKAKLIDALAVRFADCRSEKNGTLIRSDILQGLRKLYDLDGDESLRSVALGLIETEADPKYRKKYAGTWTSR